MRGVQVPVARRLENYHGGYFIASIFLLLDVRFVNLCSALRRKKGLSIILKNDAQSLFGLKAAGLNIAANRG